MSQEQRTLIDMTTPSASRITSKQFGCIVGCVLALLALLAVFGLRKVDQTIRNAYAGWWVADMVVEHMQANDGRWPANWDELRDDYQTCAQRSGQPWTFDELSQRVLVDWNADPRQLFEQSTGSQSAPFRVITLSDATTSHWESHEPNQIILEYLRSDASDEQTGRGGGTDR